MANWAMARVDRIARIGSHGITSIIGSVLCQSPLRRSVVLRSLQPVSDKERPRKLLFALTFLSILASVMVGLSTLVPQSDAFSDGTGPDVHYPLTLLDGRTVYITNLSGATMSSAEMLVQLANNSTVSQTPNQYLSSPPPGDGDFDNGDDIVITDDGLYWLSRHCRGGFLTGMWPLRNAGSERHPAFTFSNIANASEWAPNELLPGSEGDQFIPGQDCPSSPTIVPAVGGEYFLAVPLGGQDASTTCGQGTFAAGPGSNDWPVVGIEDSVRGHEHSFSFSGTAGQEFVGDTSACGAVGSPNFALEDCTGNIVHLNYTMTYSFWDAGATATGYNGTSNQERVTSRLQITPVDYSKGTPYSCQGQGDPITGRPGINLGYLNTPMDSQFYCPPGSDSTTYCTPASALQPMDRVESSVAMVQNSTLGAPCDHRLVPAHQIGTLCPVPWIDPGTEFSNVEQETPDGRPINAGQATNGCTYETFGQSHSKTKGFTLLYPNLPRLGNPLQSAPDRVEFISDGAANPPVLSPENSYIDLTRETGRSAFLPIHVTQTMTWDIQMRPYAPPASCRPRSARRAGNAP